MTREDSLSIIQADAVKTVQVMVLRKYPCCLCQMSMLNVKSVMEEDITVKLWKLNIRARISMIF